VVRKYPDDVGMRELQARIVPFIDAVAAAVLDLDGMAAKRPEPWRKAVGLAGHQANQTRRNVQAAAFRAFHAEIAAAIVDRREPRVFYGDVLASAANAAGVSERTTRSHLNETALRSLPKREKESAHTQPTNAPRKCRMKPDAWRKGTFSKKS
jgi:hypothetical protein